MKAFAYVNATSERDAVAALKFDGIALPLAGGQDLLARMKDYIDTPERVVNVKNALDRTAAPTSGGGWRIGASMKIVDLLEHADIGKMYPAIIAAATDIGTPQIRHQGTVGGNQDGSGGGQRKAKAQEAAPDAAPGSENPAEQDGKEKEQP